LAATNLEVYRGDHDLNRDYCIFGVEAANDAQTVWVNTSCGKDHSQKNRSIYNQIASAWETNLFISSRKTSCNWC